MPDLVIHSSIQRSSHKQLRAALKKERRKKKRQTLARLRDSELLEEDSVQEDESEEERKAEEERQRLHHEWLEREKVAQDEFQRKKEKEEIARRKKEEEERRIKEEWDAEKKREDEAKELKEQEKKEREEAVQKMLDQVERPLENGGTWHNPEASADYGTEKDRANCPFFLKTGACRFGDRCSRKHPHPSASQTLMIRSMFLTFGMEQSKRDDYDTDASLEYSDEEIHQQFLDFYEDVLPEFQSVGKVVQFKVSCNFEPHLRGNVYVQYQTEDECKEAFMLFNGRWYAGRQLQCEFSPVTRWKTAICGLFDRQKCPRGKHCNFLHVYRNPNRQFWEADHDYHLSPERSIQSSGRLSDNRDRTTDHLYRSRRQNSTSPDNTYKRNGENERRRAGRRSRSKDKRWSRRSRSQGRKKTRSDRSRSREWSRPSKRRSERWRSRNKSWSRSRSRENRRVSVSPRASRKRARSRSKSTSRNHAWKLSSPDTSSSEGEQMSSTKKKKHHKKSKKKKSKKEKKKKNKSKGWSSSSDMKSSGSSPEREETGTECKGLQEMPQKETSVSVESTELDSETANNKG
ncbi:U2 small nuclear ribonucleoprotein auxiliary factor 35 kDa subunit-related protein 2 isoform X1 [Polypterus senegalus]|uniref:U2 small nuclear ribonucleoprotein auxiliary factor 35 kDa subunit-related protein 2 isoform X1 n=1 Tax=Polypterus senegalus TaxID=55291 RepID=UPI001964C8C0|nr:U2 small nuclear ribonucleoprotein auxiliary factor 35 kDa subunit-related protein 2 isoform X1 [Polypterus senegalus]XP_039600937.1 U2 small nuclear ribonucleoprotein auxiliary factor 35 kDa subunit-related protein 2 isoform X1 [Polypterus senegalus]XP_039600938.1 U2 small nuclear ribonucleoprotein auxiliary factor 35 kDa subunit-related protein 2 isoform X1 [Polypterus senegalus]